MKTLTMILPPLGTASARFPIGLPPFALWMRRAAGRRRLAALDDDRLADLGISREAAMAEAARPFWDGDR